MTGGLRPLPSLESYRAPIHILRAHLPFPKAIDKLIKVVAADPFLTQGISLFLPQYRQDLNGMLCRREEQLQEGDGSTLAVTFAFLAAALRIMPKEASDLALASVPSPPLSFRIATPQPLSFSRIVGGLPSTEPDSTPLEQRYFDLAFLSAQIAEQG